MRAQKTLLKPSKKSSKILRFFYREIMVINEDWLIYTQAEEIQVSERERSS